MNPDLKPGSAGPGLNAAAPGFEAFLTPLTRPGAVQVQRLGTAMTADRKVKSPVDSLPQGQGLVYTIQLPCRMSSKGTGERTHRCACIQ